MRWFRTVASATSGVSGPSIPSCGGYHSVALVLLCGSAQAYDPDVLLQRVESVSTLREQRLLSVTPSLSEKSYREAAAGKVATGVDKVEGHAARIGWGVGIIEASIDDLWAGINDETRHADLSPMSLVKVIRGKPCADRRIVLMVLPLPLFTDRYLVHDNWLNHALHDASGGQVRELVWRSLPTPDDLVVSPDTEAIDGLVRIEFSEGAWFLVALDPGHTLAEYHSWVDPAGALPTRAATLFASRGIRDTFAAMERYARRPELPCSKGADARQSVAP